MNNNICNLCNKKYSTKGSLKTHLWEVHNIGKGSTYSCTETDCSYTTKRKSNLKRHLWEVHNIGKGNTYSCTETDCSYTTKCKGDLKKHLWEVHNIGKGSTYSCTEIDCLYTTKKKSNLKTHLWELHDIGKGSTYSCTETDCLYTTKRKSHLKRHLSGVHDIGSNYCVYCTRNVFKLNKYTDKNAGKVNICRDCYNKATGYSTTREKQMVEYIKKTELKNYIVQHDKIIKGASCNTRRRPDLIISSSRRLMILIECDEGCHSNYEAKCEWGRMNEILDETTDIRTIFIRWNPDYYKYKGKRGTINRQERLKLLVDLIRVLCKKQWTEEDNLSVFYMFYSDDHKNIITTLPNKLVYEKDDYKNLI